jgi:catechol 2,3-dioxygenase-like lactoylglutathione lyase family enzyme|tara:strand:+ start:52 stop:456 length:405 start_codon:yes stop_codon:yes gene_type:complete
MAKLRHIAMQVPNLQESAAYYENLFDLDRVCDVETDYGNAVMLSDGTMNLTLLHFPEGTKGGINGADWAGLHHMGFVVDDKAGYGKKAEDLGGSFFMELPDNIPGIDAETKYKDPNGLVFDISDHDWAQSTRKQ